MKVLFFCVVIFAVQTAGGFGQVVSTPATASLVKEATAGFVKGVVKDSNGAAIRGARVSLQSPSRRESVSFTDNEGNFLFENVAAGQYRLQVSADGFAGIDRSIQVAGDMPPQE